MPNENEIFGDNPFAKGKEKQSKKLESTLTIGCTICTMDVLLQQLLSALSSATTKKSEDIVNLKMNLWARRGRKIIDLSMDCSINVCCVCLPCIHVIAFNYNLM